MVGVCVRVFSLTLTLPSCLTDLGLGCSGDDAGDHDKLAHSLGLQRGETWMKAETTWMKAETKVVHGCADTHRQVSDGPAPALDQGRRAVEHDLYRLHVLGAAFLGVGIMLLQHLSCGLLKL